VSRRPPRSPRRRTRPTIRLPPAEVEKPQVGTKPANHRARFSGGSRSWVFDGLSVRSKSRRLAPVACPGLSGCRLGRSHGFNLA
jgi:hypothetical protein